MEIKIHGLDGHEAPFILDSLSYWFSSLRRLAGDDQIEGKKEEKRVFH